MKKIGFLWMIILSFFLFTPGASGSSLLILEESKGKYVLDSYLGIFEDKDKQISILDLLKPEAASLFAPNDGGTPNYGYTSSAYWVQWRVKNHSATEEWFLEVDYPAIDHVSLYYTTAAGLIERKDSGDLVAFKLRDVQHRNPIFKIEIEAEEEKEFYLRFETEGGMQFPLKLWNIEEFTASTQTSYLLLGIYYGIILVMSLYNLFLFFALRSLTYLYYVYVNVAILFLQLSFNGIAYQFLWPELIWWNNRSIVFFMCLTNIAASLFSRSYLNLKQYSPQLYTIFSFTVYFHSALILVLLLNYSLALHIVVLSSLIIIIIILCAGIISLRHKFKPARYFLIAWSIFLSGGVLSLLCDAGILPEYFITKYAIHIGSALEVFILSLGLAYRINILEYEKKVAELMAKRHERSSFTDSLTGLYNRRFINKKLKTLFKKAKETKATFSLMLLDIDYFKNINGTLGHHIGDYILQHISQFMNKRVRSTDIVGRFGGEEFLILLTDTDLITAIDKVNTLREDISNLQIPIDKNEALNITVNIGLTQLERNDQSMEQVLKRADESLYQAKSEGRNRVCAC